jgi:hypothetical protein
MARKRTKGTSLITSALDAQAAMWVTLRVRVPQLLAGTMTDAERRRMVTEKVAAVAESAQAASTAAAGLLRRPRRLTTPKGLLIGLTTVSAAAARPFQTRVKANARRLTKPRKTSG